MDTKADVKNPHESLATTDKIALIFWGAALSSAFVLGLVSATRFVLSTNPGSLTDNYLRALALVSAFAFCLSTFSAFFLDGMYSLLGLRKAKFFRLAVFFLLALISLILLALTMAGQKLSVGFGP